MSKSLNPYLVFPAAPSFGQKGWTISRPAGVAVAKVWGDETLAQKVADALNDEPCPRCGAQGDPPK